MRVAERVSLSEQTPEMARLRLLLPLQYHSVAPRVSLSAQVPAIDRLRLALPLQYHSVAERSSTSAHVPLIPCVDVLPKLLQYVRVAERVSLPVQVPEIDRLRLALPLQYHSVAERLSRLDPQMLRVALLVPLQ